MRQLINFLSTAANTHPNLSVYRIGTEKVNDYRMIGKDTVEEKILKYQERKKAVAADIIRTEGSIIKHLTKDDIGELFG